MDAPLDNAAAQRHPACALAQQPANLCGHACKGVLYVHWFRTSQHPPLGALAEHVDHSLRRGVCRRRMVARLPRRYGEGFRHQGSAISGLQSPGLRGLEYRVWGYKGLGGL
eukprot:360479-Chlamydomonas_euryale.AAC.11